ncbi:MAG TPA: hypothetical protein VIT62_14595 [Lysobacter sp.]
MAADRVTDQMILAAIDGFNEAAADGELFLTSLRDQARMRHALIDALRAEAGAVGFVLAPRNSTAQMEDAGLRWFTGFQHMRKQDRRNAMANAYAEMLAASPRPSQKD